MKILCRQLTNQPKLHSNQQVNRVGKYLYNHIDGAFKYKTSSNMFDVYFTLLYQLPIETQDWSKGEDYNDVHEMTINLNITTYQNKLRVNIIELTPNQKTIGYDLYLPEQMINLEEARKLILDKVVKRVSRAYKDYEFLF